jgi:hypothetical protein
VALPTGCTKNSVSKWVYVFFVEMYKRTASDGALKTRGRYVYI